MLNAGEKYLVIQNYTQGLLNLYDNMIINQLPEAYQYIELNQNKSSNFDGKNQRLFRCYQITQNYKEAQDILKRTRGDTISDECLRLLLLNQFTEVFRMLSTTQILNDELQIILAISIYYNSSLYDTEGISSQHHNIRFLTQLSSLHTYKTYLKTPYLSIIENELRQLFRLQNNFRLHYVEKFRLQAFHFQYEDQLLNSSLIEMNFIQLCRIIQLPRDYFDKYYEAFMYIIDKIISKEIIGDNQNYEYFINLLNISIPYIFVNDLQLFKNAVHTGITRAIVNNKIQLANRFKHSLISLQEITGILDGALILRRISKASSIDVIDDIIYETLIYKLV